MLYYYFEILLTCIAGLVSPEYFLCGDFGIRLKYLELKFFQPSRKTETIIVL